MTNGTESSTQFANFFAQLVTTCGTLSDAANVLMAADPVTEIERVHVLNQRTRILVALAVRIEQMDKAGDTFCHLSYTAEELAVIADPLGA